MAETQKWFIVVGARTIGPIEKRDLMINLGSGKVSPAHFAWSEGMDDWVRLVNLGEFSSLMPDKPPGDLIEKLKTPEPPPAKPVPREWYFFVDDSQEGPYDLEECRKMFNSGMVTASSYTWKSGMENWIPLSDIPVLFKIYSETSKPATPPPPTSPPSIPAPPAAGTKAPPEPPPQEPTVESPSDKRTSPRKPIQARVLFHDNEILGDGVVRDLSIGGAQILFDSLGGKTIPVGSGIRMNVNATGTGQIQFVAEATVVRHLGSGRGFAVRFENLPEESLKAIEGYISGENP